MPHLNLDAKIEAILFLLGEPVKIEFLAKILGEEANKVYEAICILEKNLENRGVCLIQKDGKIMLSTSGAASDITKKIIKEKYEEELTKPMLETLAIILYKCPVYPATGGVSKVEIDYVRGVNSVFTLRNLLIRGLIERSTSKQKSFLYQPSFQLLQFLGIKNLKDLPEAEHFKQKIEQFLNIARV